MWSTTATRHSRTSEACPWFIRARFGVLRLCAGAPNLNAGEAREEARARDVQPVRDEGTPERGFHEFPATE